MPPCRRNFRTPNITGILLQSAPQTQLRELIALPQTLSLDLRGPRRGAEAKGKDKGKRKEKKGKQRGGNGMMARRGKLENGGKGGLAPPSHNLYLPLY